MAARKTSSGKLAVVASVMLATSAYAAQPIPSDAGMQNPSDIYKNRAIPEEMRCPRGMVWSAWMKRCHLPWGRRQRGGNR
jgi:hypothetical protein